jgi:uncharacterized protein with HEPN domain
MPPEVLKLLVDIQSSLGEIRDFTAGMDYGAYRLDAKCRAAVERKFEIIGEACTRLRDRFPESYSKIDSGPQIVGFRNRLIHGYDNVDDAIVWDIVTRKLPELTVQVEALMK